MKLVPELLCTDIDATKAFYTTVLGFAIKYERSEERFAYFTLDGVDVMCEELDGPGRRWITGEMSVPYGRGVNLQWEVNNVNALFDRISRSHPEAIYMELEEREYRCGTEVVHQAQFIVQDPDGYLYRFCSV